MIGLTSTVCSILGISLGDIPKITILDRVIIVTIVYFLIFIIAFYLIGYLFKEKIELMVNNTSVSISCGDIFNTNGYKVIGCDTHFHIRVDDEVISKTSLHGKLVLEHGDKDEIKSAINKEAKRQGLEIDQDGLYTFPLGTIIKYNSSIDNQTYLLLAMTELNKEYESHTSIAKYEQMIMKMWEEINRVYASNDIVLPILGDGITRFDVTKDKNMLLRCMICTLKGSGKSFNSQIKIVIYGNTSKLSLYELKDIGKSTGRR